MSVVIDSSTVVAALVATGPDGAWAEQLLAVHPLYAPELLLVEATNILRRLELSDRITAPAASSAQGDLLQLPIELFPFAPFAERVWELRPSVTSYDAWYVALAEALGFPLATLDERLTRSSGPACDFLTPASR